MGLATLALVTAATLSPARTVSLPTDTAATAPAIPLRLDLGPDSAAADTTHRRPRAIEYSDAYATRLTIHRIGSYTMLPLFSAEYLLGDRLMNGTSPAPSWVKPTHVGVALGLGTLFAVNTVTGVWNLYDSRHDPSGRTRRILHTALLLAADAGFAYTGTITSDDATHSLDGRDRHRTAALTSMGIATVGTAMMWLWK